MDRDKQTPKEAMGGHEKPAPHPPIPAGTVAFEKADTDPGSIVRVASILIAVSVLATVAAFGLFRALGTREERRDPPAPRLARSDEGRLPPAPRLQTAPADELLELRAAEHQQLSGYGWVDEARGVARIPIEEAMALYASRMRAPEGAPAAVPSPASRGGASPAAPVRR